MRKRGHSRGRGGSRAKTARRPIRRQQSNLVWWLLIILVLLVVSALGYTYLQVTKNSEYDEATLCPMSGPTGVLVTVLDLSDPLSQLQANRLENELARRIEDAPEGTMISLGVVRSDIDTSGIRFSMCRPRGGWEANMLYQNRALIERRFTEGFQRPLSEALTALLEGEELPISPIIETMHQVVLDTQGYRSVDVSKSIVLVSDLYQNSGVHSFYRGHDWQSFAGSPEFATKSKFLEGFDVTLIRIPRPVPQQSSNDSVEDFWVNFLETSGAASVDVDYATLGGL